MIRKKYKEFYEFVELNCPELCKLWEECNDRPVPIIGQEYICNLYGDKIKASFYKILFDENFKNGAAFFYIFNRNDTGQKISIRSVSFVYNKDKLTEEDKKDLFRFWKDCEPIK